MRAPVFLLFFAVVTAPSIVAAQGTEADRDTATKLFEHGVEKMQEGKCNEVPIASPPPCREALEAFRKAYALYPALGALRNLAYVERGLGMLASALRDFRELARLAVADPRPDRQEWADFARKEAETIAPRVPKITIAIPADRPQGTVVRLDGQFLDASRWEQPVEVDPGEHVVECDAPERKHFRATITLAAGGSERVSVVLDRPAPSSIGTTPDVAGPSHTPAMVVTAVGVAGLGVGLGFGWAAWQKKKDACAGSDGLCDPAMVDSGKRLGNVSTIVTLTGGVVTATGIAWWLLQPSSVEKRTLSIAPYAGPSNLGMVFAGSFR